MNATRTTGSRRRSTRAGTTRRRNPRWYPTRRRRRPGLSTTIGSALGMLAVTTLLNMSWPARIGLLVLVLVVGLSYILWRHRAEIAAAAAVAGPEGTAGTDDAGAGDDPADDTDDATEPDGIPKDVPAPPTPQDRPAATNPEASTP